MCRPVITIITVVPLQGLACRPIMTVVPPRPRFPTTSPNSSRKLVQCQLQTLFDDVLLSRVAISGYSDFMCYRNSASYDICDKPGMGYVLGHLQVVNYGNYGNNPCFVYV